MIRMNFTFHIRRRAAYILHEFRKHGFYSNCRQVSGKSCQEGCRVVFFGSDEFSLQHLKTLHWHCQSQNQRKEAFVSHLEIVSSAPKFIRRRGHKKLNLSPVAHYCQRRGLPLHYWPIEDLSGFDLGVVVSFGHMIPHKLIKSFPLGILNVHPSLLPRWRGAAPIPHTILAGDSVTGVTIIRIKPDRFDVGPIISQEEVVVPEESTTESLTELLSKKGSEMLLCVLRDLEHHLKNEREQSNKGITIASKLKPSQGLINWQMTSLEISKVCRAAAGQIPIKSSWRGEEFRLFEMVPLKENSAYSKDINNLQPALGLMQYHRPSTSLQIRCKDAWVGFRSVGFGRRKNMSAKEFYNGYLSSHRAGSQTVLEGGVETT